MGKVIAIVVVCIFLLGGIFACSDSSSSSGRKCSELSEVEKQNARWAYEVQQSLNK